MPLAAGGVPTAMVLLQIAWVLVRSGVVTSVGLPIAAEGVVLALFAGALVAAMPARSIERLDRGLEALARDARGAAALTVAAALVIGVGGALVQQVPSWDERFMMPAVRLAADEGLSTFFEKYASLEWLGRQHPPLPVLVYAAIRRVTGCDLLGLRLATVLLGAASLLAALSVARRLVRPGTALLSILLLLASPLFVRIESAAMNDLFVTAFFLAALDLVLRISRAPSTGGAILLGLCVGCGLVSKYTMTIASPVLAVAALHEGTLWRRRREWAIGVAVAAAIAGAWVFLGLRIGVFGGQAEWFDEMARTSTGSSYGFHNALEAIFTKLPSGLGVYLMPILAGGVAAFARSGGASARLLAAWVALVSLPLLVTLPDNRYFLPAYPALSIV
ncbi:MAG: glycosyltransferase family 39 protein, partial [Alphaproteobacteria bacterium]